jgi:hypothetical protein
VTVTKFLQRWLHKSAYRYIYKHHTHLINNMKMRHRVTGPCKNKHLSSDKVKKTLSQLVTRNFNKNKGHFEGLSIS